MENKYILCIDLGTSGPKVSLVNVLGEVLMHEFEPTPMYFLPNGGAEQKPGDWWNAVKNAAKRLITRATRASTRYYCHLRHQPVVHHGGSGQKWSPIDERHFMDGYARRKIRQKHHGWTNKNRRLWHYQITRMVESYRRYPGTFRQGSPSLTSYTSKMNCRIFIGTLINFSNQRII